MPRLRPSRLVVLAVAALASAAMPVPLSAQPAADSQIFQPAFDGDPRAPPRFGPPAPSIGTSRFGARRDRRDEVPARFEVPKYGHPPAFGAGTSGFDSSHARRKRKARARPGVPVSGAIAATARAIAREAPQLRPRDSVPPVSTERTAPARIVPVRRRPVVEEDPFAPVGIRAGAFVLRPAIEITGGYDNNASRTATPQGSALMIVAPEFRARSDWQRHALNVDITASYTDYERTFGGAGGLPGASGTPRSLDRPALDARVSGRIDVTRNQRVELEGRVLVSTDNPGSPNVMAGLERLPIVTRTGGTLGYARRFNWLEIAAKGSADRAVYQASSLTDGSTASNDDSNFDQYAGSLRASYELTPGVKPFLEGGLDTRLHDLAVDRSGMRRDSEGATARVGTTFEITRKLTGEVASGYLTRRYQDPSLRELAGATLDASLVWTASALTRVSLTARSNADETIVAGVSGTLRRDFGLQVDHAFRRWLIGTVRLGYGLDDYVGSERDDERYSLSAALLYKLTRTTQIKGEFRQDWLHSSVPGVDYTASAVLLGLRFER